MTERYDTDTAILWVASDAGADDLIPRDELQVWIDALSAQAMPDGRPLRGVNYVFGDAGAAEYNYHPLKFSKLGTFVGSIDDPRPVGDDGVSFDTKDDFGI